MQDSTESDLDAQAYCRSLALQQIQMLTRLAEIGMQLAEAERARRRAAAVTLVEEAFAKVDPARLPGLRAGLAVRLGEPDVIAWLDSQTSFATADRLCRSLGVDQYLFIERPDDLDTG